MFICDTCLADSTKEDELRQATEFTKDLPFEERGKAQRKFLVQTFRWNGRW